MARPKKGQKPSGQIASQEKRDRLLGLLRNGDSVRSACTKIGITKGTYDYYRSNYPDFARVASEIIAERRVSIDDLPRLDDKLKKFITCFRQTGDRIRSANKASMSVTAVEERLDKEHAHYNPRFERHYREVEKRHLWALEDSVLVEASQKGGSQARFVLQCRMPARYKTPLSPMPGLREPAENKNLFFFQIGDNQKKAEELVEGILSKFEPAKEITDGGNNVSNQEARSDIPAVVVCDGVG